MEFTLIYGSPGTGKTTKLLSILDDCFKQNIPPEKIAFVSFTRKGTYEGRDRAVDRFGYNEERFPYFRTIHSLAFRFLDLRPNQMVTKTHYKDLSKLLNMNFSGYYTEDLKNDDDKYIFCESLQRNNKQAATIMLDGINNKLFEWVKENYIEYKKRKKVYDYTDIVELSIKNKINIPVDIAIIDEGQDLTSLQWEFVWLAFNKCKKIFVAGDDDQAIYEWSGADVKQFLALNKKANNIITLDKSWRLPYEIHSYASLITGSMINRIQKKFSHNGSKGVIKFVNDIKTIPIDNESSWAILCRNNYYLDSVCDYLYNKGICFERNNKLSYSQGVIKAIQSYNLIKKGLYDNNKYLIKKFMPGDSYDGDWFDAFTKLSYETRVYYKKILENKSYISPVFIGTIHSIKGGEADNVVLLMQYTKTIEENYLKNADAELRCYYVAVTRARKNLYLVQSETRNGYKLLQ